MHELNSFDRYKQGKELSVKWTIQMVRGYLATLLWGFMGMFLYINYSLDFFIAVSFLFIPFYPTLQASLKATRGDMMMKSAIETFGSDEEEY